MTPGTMRDMSQMLLGAIRAEDQIAGKCPSCGGIMRLSEVELFYIPDRKKDFLADVRKMKEDLEDEMDGIIKDRLRRSRASLMGSLVEQIAPFLPDFHHDPHDLRALWDPIDYIAFNGIGSDRNVESITLIDIKSGNSRLSSIQKSIQEAVEKGNVEFETVETQPSDDISERKS